MPTKKTKTSDQLLRHRLAKAEIRRDRQLDWVEQQASKHRAKIETEFENAVARVEMAFGS